MEELTAAGVTPDMLGGLLTGGVLGVLLTLGILGSILSLVYNILIIVSNWKIFTKLGEPGWKSLIPFYNTWVEYNYTWKPTMSIGLWIFSIVGALMTYYAADGSALYYIGLLVTFVGWVIMVMGLHKLSKAFGHGAGFTVGLVLATGIFMIILGFGKSQYVGNPSEGDAN